MYKVLGPGQHYKKLGAYTRINPGGGEVFRTTLWIFIEQSRIPWTKVIHLWNIGIKLLNKRTKLINKGTKLINKGTKLLNKGKKL